MTEQDIPVWRGNGYRVVGWSFPFELEGSDIRLTVAWRGGTSSFALSTGGLIIENAEIDGQSRPVVWWEPTAADTRAIGSNAAYEVERIVPDGEQRTYVAGKIILEGGLNLD